MTFDLHFFLFAVPAVIFAGLSKGGFGSAAAFAATPFLALILTPGQAVGLMLPLLMVMDVTAIRVFWRKWDGSAARVLIAGAVPGIVIGALVYGIAKPEVFKFLIGLVAIGFVAYQGAKAKGWIKPPKRTIGRFGGTMWGLVTGFTSFISHAGGPPAAVYMLSQRMDKTTYQATSVLVFWAINLIKVVPYSIVGIFTPETLKADLMLFPFAILGVLMGAWLHHKISDRFFFALAYVFLVITGGQVDLGGFGIARLCVVAFGLCHLGGHFKRLPRGDEAAHAIGLGHQKRPCAGLGGGKEFHHSVVRCKADGLAAFAILGAQPLKHLIALTAGLLRGGRVGRVKHPNAPIRAAREISFIVLSFSSVGRSRVNIGHPEKIMRKSCCKSAKNMVKATG